jgi:hypothetical protein
MMRRSLVPILLVLLAFGCARKKAPSTDPGSGAPAPVAKATLTPDVKTVQAYLADDALVKGELRGKSVKVHGYAVVMNPTKVAVSATPEASIPFVACVGSLPAGVGARAHVLAEGTVDELGQLASCKLSPL